MAEARPSSAPQRHPEGVLPSVRTLTFACPLCRGAIDANDDVYRCDACDRVFGHHAGIPDFRVFDDPYLDFAEDRERTEVVLSGLAEHADLAGLLDYYWSFSDVTPPVLRAKFVRNALLGERRARRELAALTSGTFAEPLPPGGRLLEIGSGTGNTLVVAAEHFRSVVGTDIGMRWLHLSRRRFEERGLPVPALVCCCAEALPFPDRSFDVTWMSSTHEFLRDRELALAECARVLTPAGAAWIKTCNRFSLARDPYVYLWGVGWLPRSLQARYVRWRRDADYSHVNLVSRNELADTASRSFERCEFALPDIDDESLANLSPAIRAQVHIYRVLKRLPGMSWALERLGPEWDVKLSGPRSPGAAPS